MNHPATSNCDVAVIGAGPAGIVAALRAADLGAKTILVASGEFGGMAANDGPVPVRTLAHAARLLRDARQLGSYGIAATGIGLDYAALLSRVREVAGEARAQSSFRRQLDELGVEVREHSGPAHFIDPHTIASASWRPFRADAIIVCTGGRSRRLPIPGFELTKTHSDAWALERVPSSMLVIGAGATGAQVASVFNAFGTQVTLLQAGPRILPSEDVDVSVAIADAFRKAGIEVVEGFGAIRHFERTAAGVHMAYGKDGTEHSAEAELAVVAVGWEANTAELIPAAAGIALDDRKFIKVDSHLRTSVDHIYAAGDAIGRMMLVPQAVQGGFIAATNAVHGPRLAVHDHAAPVGSFTDPEYAQVGLTETQARAQHTIVAGSISFDTTTRTIIDGRTDGFCKLVVDASSHRILGCHVVGERAVEIVQLAALAMSGGMGVDALARAPLSYPTYGAVLSRVAAKVARELSGRGARGSSPAESYLPN